MHYTKMPTVVIVSLLLFQSFFVHAGAVSSLANQDDFRKIRYSDAFEQSDLWRGEFRPLMEHMGCDENVFEENVFLEGSSDGGAYHSITIQEDMTDRVQAYEEACMRRLNNTRRRALAEPGIFALAEIGLFSAGGVAAFNLLGGSSMGGSFAIFSAMFTALAKMPGIILSGYNLMNWPDNPLEPHEDRFAKNKCFIPRALWPKIERAFISARTNEFEREGHTHFLNFALGITTFKPQPPLRLKEDYLLDGVKDELDARLHRLFENYTPESRNPRELCLISLNVKKFVNQLYGTSAGQAPRYLFFGGPGGIGKTHLGNQLALWLQELLPDSVNFESLVINSAAELEGTSERPGALLKVLHNQLARNKRGSLVVIDEATWLNEPGMRACSKRTFNLDQSKLCTSYFGNGPEGAGVSLEVPPMLVLVASNEEISDENLASRFDVIHYPLPSKSALALHAAAIAQKSDALKYARRQVEHDEVASWIETLTKEQLNFRFVAGNVEAEFLAGLSNPLLPSSSSGSGN